MLFPISTQIPFLAQFTYNKAGVTGLTVYVSVVRVNTDGSRNTVISAASNTAATEVDSINQPGVYSYLLASGSTGTAGYYAATFRTAGTVDLSNIPALEIVGPAWVATAGAAAAPGDILATPANKLVTDSSGRVTVADKTGFALTTAEHNNIQTDAATGVLVTPAQKIATDSSNRVTAASVAGSVGSVSGAVGSVTGNVGGNVTGSVGSLAAQAQADVQTAMTTQGYTSARAGYLDTLSGLVQAVWDKAASALNTVGSIGKRIVDNLNAPVGSLPTTAPDNTSITQIRTVTDHLATALEQNGGVYRFTQNAMAQAPTGSGDAADPDAIALAVWQKLTIDLLAASGSVGALLVSKLTALNPPAQVIRVISPVAPGEDLELYVGAAYQATRTSQIEFPLSDAAPDLTDATLTLLISNGGPVLLSLAGVVSGPSNAQVVTVEATSAQTLTLLGHATTKAHYALEASWPDGSMRPLTNGVCVIANP